MKLARILFLIAVLLNFSGNLFAVEVGERVPELKVSEWAAGNKIVFYPKKKDNTKKIYILFFWATWLKEADRFFDFLLTEESFYKGNNLVFIGISRERPALLKKFLNERKDQKTSISFAVDNDSQTYNSFMHNVKGFPVFFIINNNGRLLWRGQAVEFDRVIRRVIEENFDLDKQNEIEKLRARAREYSLVLDKDKEMEFSRKILEIDPTDETSVKIISENLADENKFDEALKVIEDAIKASANSKYTQRNLFINELFVISKMPLPMQKRYLAKTVSKYYKIYSSNSFYINDFAIRIIREFNLEVLPVAELLEAVKRASEIEQNDKNKASIYITLARLYYIIGNFKRAIDLQEKVFSILTDKDREYEAAKLNLEFYKEMNILKDKESY